jgi:hypothetical protein
MRYIVLFLLMLLMIGMTTTIEGLKNKKGKKHKKRKDKVKRTSEDCNIQYNTSTRIPEEERRRDHHNCLKSM